MSNRQAALNLRLEGYTYQAIADQLGISRTRAQQLVTPPTAVKRVIEDRHDFRCAYCQLFVGRQGDVHQIDYQDGDHYDDLSKLTLLCRSCHKLAHDN